MTFSRDGKLLVSGTYNATLIAWDPESGELLQKINAFPSGIASLGMDARDGSLLSGGPDGGLLRWQAITSELPVPVTLDTLGQSNATAASGDFYHDFRGAKPLPGFFKVQNYDNQANLTSEKEGLRITLPAARTHRSGRVEAIHEFGGRLRSHRRVRDSECGANLQRATAWA